jgi:hypothetical protein
MWFLLSLVTAISAVYAYPKAERFSAEVAIACVAIGLIGAGLALIIAPWPIQGLLVLSAIASSRFIGSHY